MSVNARTGDWTPFIANRAYIRVSLSMLSALFRDGSHAYGVTGGIPYNGRVVHVEMDACRNEAVLHIEADTASHRIPATPEGHPATEITPIVHALGIDGLMLRSPYTPE